MRNRYYLNDDHYVTYDSFGNDVKHDLFNMTTQLSMGKFGAIKEMSNATSQLRFFKSEIARCTEEAMRMHKLKDSYILAIIKCLNDQVSTTFSHKTAEDISTEYKKSGFNSEKVQNFIKDVKDTFFSEIMRNKDKANLLDGMRCVSLPTFDSTNGICYSHFNVEFILPACNKNLEICIPLFEHSKFSPNTYEDYMRGRFLLKTRRSCTSIRTPVGLIKDMSSMETVVIEAKFNPDELNHAVSDFLTSDKYDKSSIFNYSQMPVMLDF